MQRIKLENRDEIYYLFTKEEVVDIQCETSMANGLLLDLDSYYSGIEKIDNKLFNLLHDNLPVKFCTKNNNYGISHIHNR